MMVIRLADAPGNLLLTLISYSAVMQISASTLLASQQVGQAHAKPAAGFAQALEKASGFQPLALKQTAPAADALLDALAPTPKGPQKLGSAIDIKV
jgi:hypothetical protein